MSGLCYTRTLKFLDLAYNAIGGSVADAASTGIKSTGGHLVDNRLLPEDDDSVMGALAAGDISVAGNAVSALAMALSRDYGSSFTRGSGGSRVIDIDLSFNAIGDADGVVLLSALLPASMHPSSITGRNDEAYERNKKRAAAEKRKKNNKGIGKGEFVADETAQPAEEPPAGTSDYHF